MRAGWGHQGQITYHQDHLRASYHHVRYITVACLHGTKAATKAELTKDIQGQKRRPHGYVSFPAPFFCGVVSIVGTSLTFRWFLQILAPNADSFQDIFLHGIQRACGEGLIQELPPRSMSIAIWNELSGWLWADGACSIRPPCLDDICLSIGVDILDRPRSSKCQRIRCESHHITFSDVNLEFPCY